MGVFEGGLDINADSIDEGALFDDQIVGFLVDDVDERDQVIDFSIFLAFFCSSISSTFVRPRKSSIFTFLRA